MSSTSHRAPDPAAAEGLVDDPGRRRAILIAVRVALMAVIASVSGLHAITTARVLTSTSLTKLPRRQDALLNPAWRLRLGA